jgi:hypothetical protein
VDLAVAGTIGGVGDGSLALPVIGLSDGSPRQQIAGVAGGSQLVLDVHALTGRAGYRRGLGARRFRHCAAGLATRHVSGASALVTPASARSRQATREACKLAGACGEGIACDLAEGHPRALSHYDRAYDEARRGRTSRIALPIIGEAIGSLADGAAAIGAIDSSQRYADTPLLAKDSDPRTQIRSRRDS